MRRLTLAAVTVSLAVSAVPAGAAERPDPGRAKVVGTPYMYLGTMHGQTGIIAVFRLDGQLDRQPDGLVRGTVAVAHFRASLRTVGRRSRACYSGFAPVRNGLLRGTTRRVPVAIGKRYDITIRRRSGGDPGIKRTLTLRRQQPGMAAGRPLGC